jgi:hypothetical protein
MQKKQVKQVAKTKAASKPAAKGAAKPAAKSAPKAAAKPAAKAASKAPAKTATKATTAKAAPKASAPKAAAPKPGAAKVPVKPAKSAAAKTAARDDARGASRSTSRSVVKPTSRHRHDDTSMKPVPVPKAVITAAIIPQRAFTFEDAGRTFNCRVEPLRPSGADAWWWFDVSTEQHQRHAPFRAEAGDTLEAVRLRVVKYYDELLARRAEPAPSRWNRRPSTPGTPAVAAVVEGEDEEAPEDAEGVDLEGDEEPNPDEPEMVDLSEAEGIAEDATT